MNYYHKEECIGQYMKMDGTFEKSDRFLLTQGIAVKAGDRVLFGPVRLGQPVMGAFYDAEDRLIELFNHTKAEVYHTFKEGMVMASIVAPAAAAAVRLELTPAEKDVFCIYINEEQIPEDTFTNPLDGRTVLNIGDSLCAANNDPEVEGMRGWSRRLHQTYGAQVTNSASPGAAVSDIRLKQGHRAIKCILNQMLPHTDAHFEYILLEGGGNDGSYEAPLGEISESFDPATFDLSTFAGGLELMIYQAVKDHGDTAAIGYMSVYKMPLHNTMYRTGKYFELGGQICKKWGIEYLDLYNNLEFDTKEYTIQMKTGEPDFVHADTRGYEIMQPHINEFMLKIRPIPFEIYHKV